MIRRTPNDFWDLVFVAAIASGASPMRAAENADASLELRQAKRGDLSNPPKPMPPELESLG